MLAVTPSVKTGSDGHPSRSEVAPQIEQQFKGTLGSSCYAADALTRMSLMVGKLPAIVERQQRKLSAEFNARVALRAGKEDMLVANHSFNFQDIVLA